MESCAARRAWLLFAVLAIVFAVSVAILRQGARAVPERVALVVTPTTVHSAARERSLVPSDAGATVASTASPTFASRETPATHVASPPTSSVTSIATPTLIPEPADTGVGVVRGNVERPWIALTFDTDHRPERARSILATLREKNVSCTFFVVGSSIRQDPDLLREIVADGHELGNHSDTHVRFTGLTDEQIGRELAAVEDAAMKLTGHSTKPYFRAPQGITDERVRRVVRDHGYITIYWTAHVGDWMEAATPESVLSYALRYACNGAILLLHASSPETADALPRIIEGLQARGYRLVTLSEVLAP